MWIRDPTPVISSTKQIDNWSTCRPKSTCRLPTGTQLNRFWLMVRASPCRPSMSASSVTPMSRCHHESVRLTQSTKRAAHGADRPPTTQVKLDTDSPLEQVRVDD